MGRTPLALTPEASQARHGSQPHDPGLRSAMLRPRKATHDMRMATLTIATTPPGEQETMTKATPHRTVGEPSPCQQYRHDWHCSATPCHAHGMGSKTTTTMPRCTMTPGQDNMACQASLLTSPSLGLSTTRVGRTHLSTCNLAPELYIRMVRPPFTGDGLSKLHSGFRPPHSSYLESLSLHTLIVRL
jgi:hypothetical protein